MRRIELLNMLSTSFNDSELREVCMELDVDYESLPGMGKRDKARELVLYLERRERLSELLETCQRLRPNVTWPFSKQTFHDPGMPVSVKILFLAANPSDTTRLRLDHEVREIIEALRRTEFREMFDLEQYWAIRVTDLQGCLLSHKPHIVHFSGHGSEANELTFEDTFGDSQPVSATALSKLFSVLKDDIRCVVLNACYSEQQAQAIAEHIDCVIGMSKAIGDPSAISFATAFYQALGYGKDVKTAFDLGCVQIGLENLNEYDTPKLFASRCNPKEIVFVHSD